MYIYICLYIYRERDIACYNCHAAFCTVIDILDDDIESDWVLTGVERYKEQIIPSTLNLIAEAMRSFRADSCLQSRGCHCIGLLVPLAPQGLVLTETIAALFDAAQRHARHSGVVRDVLFAFHSLLEPGAGAHAAEPALPQAHMAMVETLREGDAVAVAWQALQDHPDLQNSELIEEAVIVLCCLAGVDTALKGLVDTGPGPVRTVGVKAIAEFGRHRPCLLRQFGGNVSATVMRMASENIDDATLQQNVALLVGLCSS